MPASWRATPTDKWNNPWFLALSLEAAHLWDFYCHSPATTNSGVYRIDPRVVLIQTGLTQEQIEKCNAHFTDTRRAYFEDWWVCLPTYPEHQPKKNVNIWAGILRQLTDVPPGLLEKWLRASAGYVPAKLKAIVPMLAARVEADNVELQQQIWDRVGQLLRPGSTPHKKPPWEQAKDDDKARLEREQTQMADATDKRLRNGARKRKAAEEAAKLDPDKMDRLWERLGGKKDE
jgi:hypothetical protein